MTAPGPSAVARAVQGAVTSSVGALFTQGTVTAASGNIVTVALPGSTDPIVVPRLKSYSAPAVGDVVWLVGPPGSWVCIGALA